MRGPVLSLLMVITGRAAHTADLDGAGVPELAARCAPGWSPKGRRCPGQSPPPVCPQADRRTGRKRFRGRQGLSHESRCDRARVCASTVRRPQDPSATMPLDGPLTAPVRTPGNYAHDGPVTCPCLTSITRRHPCAASNSSGQPPQTPQRSGDLAPLRPEAIVSCTRE